MRRSLPRSIAGAALVLLTATLLIGGCGATDSPVEPTVAASLPTQPSPTAAAASDSPTPSSPTAPAAVAPTAEPTATFTALPQQRPPTATTTAAAAPATAAPTATAAAPTVSPTSTTVPDAIQSGQPHGMIIDHRSVDKFEAIPPEALQAAANLSMFYADRSVGQNLNEALDCLAVPQASAPNYCVRYIHRDPAYNTAPADVSWPGVYPRANWRFVSCTEVECTIDQYAATPVQVFGLFPNYFDGPDLDGRVAETFQPLLDLREAQPGVEDPRVSPPQGGQGVTLIAFTTSLPRGTADGGNDEYKMMLANEQIRAWARENAVPLLDVADILSHTPGGEPCYDNRDGVAYYVNEKQQEDFPDDGMNIPAICPQYTTEAFGGHLGSVSAGRIRMAKALWVLMARLAGWTG